MTRSRPLRAGTKRFTLSGAKSKKKSSQFLLCISSMNLFVFLMFRSCAARVLSSRAVLAARRRCHAGLTAANISLWLKA